MTDEEMDRLSRLFEPAPKPDAPEADIRLFMNLLGVMGYQYVRYVPGYGWCAVSRYIFTVGLVLGVSGYGLEGRFCFKGLGPALSFYLGWDGSAPPVVGQDGCTADKADGYDIDKHPDYPGSVWQKGYANINSLNRVSDD
jgi:hypothetical protein